MTELTAIPANFSINEQGSPTKKIKKQPRAKIERRVINGVILLNKPKEISSNGALQKVRFLLKADKGGHTGALDPMATGLLPLCFGEATKFSHYLLDAQKSYQTTILLGTATDSGDADGQLTEQKEIPALTESMIQEVLQQFTGDIFQIPPMYSALKKEGRPLYELARQGIEIERPARPITVYQIRLNNFTAHTLTLTVSCSKGTYIRTLGEDIAKALGTVGHLIALHRVETGHFMLDEQLTLDYLESLSLAELESLLLPSDSLVSTLPVLTLNDRQSNYFLRGQGVKLFGLYADKPIGEYVVSNQTEGCLGIGVLENDSLQPKRVLNLPRNIATLEQLREQSSSSTPSITITEE